MKPVGHSEGTALSEIELDGVVGGLGIDTLAMGALGALGGMMMGPMDGYYDGPGDYYGPEYGPEDYGPEEYAGDYGPEGYY